MKRHRARNEASWAKGQDAAIDRGRAAADDATRTEDNNPYTRYEHKKLWAYGFRARRKELAAPPAPHQYKLPYKD